MPSARSDPAVTARPPPDRYVSEADVRGHVPVHVVWEVTLACNLKCHHCGSRAGKARPDELSPDEALEVVAALAALGTREITLIGGEAFMRRDWLRISSKRCADVKSSSFERPRIPTVLSSPRSTARPLCSARIPTAVR